MTYLNLSRAPNEKLIFDDGGALIITVGPKLTTSTYADAIKGAHAPHVDRGSPRRSAHETGVRQHGR